MNIKRRNLMLKIFIPIFLLCIFICGKKLYNPYANEKSSNSLVKNTQVSKDKEKQQSLIVYDKKEYGDLKGLSQIFGFYGDNNIIVSIGMTKEEFDKKYVEKRNIDYKKLKNDEVKKLEQYDFKCFNDKWGRLFNVTLDSLNKSPLKLNDKYMRTYSENLNINMLEHVEKLTWFKDNKRYIYDIRKEKASECKFKYAVGTLDNKNDSISEDGNYLIRYLLDKFGVEVHNIKENTSKFIPIKLNKMHVYSMDKFHSEHGKKVYFIGQERGVKDYENREGIYKVDVDTKEVKSVMTLPYYIDEIEKKYDKKTCFMENYIRDARNEKTPEYCILGDFCILDDGNKVLIELCLKGEFGTFIYDVKENKYYKVVSHVQPDKNNYRKCNSYFGVSPDKTKVVYTVLSNKLEKNRWNLYVSSINGNEFKDTVCLEKDIVLCNSDKNMIHWSNDSKKIIYAKGTQVGKSKNSKVEFNDKDIITVVTFK